MLGDRGAKSTGTDAATLQMESSTALRLFDKVTTRSHPPPAHSSSPAANHRPRSRASSQFDLVACAESTDAMAGSAIEALPDLFVDMVAVGDTCDPRHYATRDGWHTRGIESMICLTVTASHLASVTTPDAELSTK